jgi:hypothetical protein
MQATRKLLGIQSVDKSKALSKWVFIHPSYLERAEKVLAQNRSKGFVLVGHIPDEKDIALLQKRLGTDKVIVLEQHAGETVQVPPGWVHAVINLQSNVKVANDLYVPEYFPAYVRSWQRVATVFGKRRGKEDKEGNPLDSPNAADYMSMLRVLYIHMARIGTGVQRWLLQQHQ